MIAARWISLLSLLIVLMATACGGSAGSVTYASLPPTGSAESGQSLFMQGFKKAQACGSCHSVDGTKEVGPSLKGIATTAGTRVAGQDAETYLFESITSPNKYVVSGYSAGIMPANFAVEYSPQQIRDLITYLMALK